MTPHDADRRRLAEDIMDIVDGEDGVVAVNGLALALASVVAQLDGLVEVEEVCEILAELVEEMRPYAEVAEAERRGAMLLSLPHGPGEA